MEGASTGMESVTSALSSSFTEMGTTMSGMITTILPIALGLIGAVLAINFGIKLFKKVTGKA